MPLRLDFHIGLPRDDPGRAHCRVQAAVPLARASGAAHTPPALIKKVLSAGSLLRKSLVMLADVDTNDRRYLEVELPAGNGVGTARAIARAYSASPKAAPSSGLRRRRSQRHGAARCRAS